MLTSPQLIQAKAIHRQIGDHVRELIVSGKLVPETKLPATEKLAASWLTNPKTIQKALAPLVKEGLLTRVPKRGTFVRKREEKLTCVAVYDQAGTIRESQFEQALQAALKEELTAAGIEMDVWLDSRPVAEQGALGAEQGEPWLPLVKAAERREFQALIATSADLPHLSWQRRLPVPTAFQSTPNIPNAVGYNLAQFAELSLRALAQQGCQSVGIISIVATSEKARDDSRQIFAEFYGRLTDVAGDLGLRVKNEWIRLPTAAATGGGPAQENFGYEEFLKLWSQPEKPAGLIVFPDTTARGVILGLRERQVRVPEELKLVLHKNEAVGLLCPMPATFAVLSERAIAKALIKQVQKQFRGEVCEPIVISFNVESNAGR